MSKNEPGLEPWSFENPRPPEFEELRETELEFLIWTESLWNYYKKLFGSGTTLVVTDKHLDADVSPKPTIFLPSIAETNLHKAGTYLCLLETFFPDVIKIHWQEKKSNTILGSQEGNTMKTNDTYMKFSWLTVPEKSLDKEHRCIVRHENNKNGVDQEIIFPPIKTDVITMDPKDNCSKDANYKHLDADVSPKPTIFLPSIAETNLHKAGTYLCLLEKFFPDVIKIHWQEKKSNKILGSQEGNTMKTNDTYMKFSWLTVPEKSLDKEHRCIVRHENNKNGVDQEIIFPPIKTDVTTVDPKDSYSKDANDVTTVDPKYNYSKDANDVITMDPKDNWSKDANDALLLQLTNTSAYYMYLLLLLKSVVYFAIIAFCLLRRTAVCCNGVKS
ncbi:T-cell receptor gamma alternate reading frame protein isoform X2 [Pongo abelii]|nr:TCR gamma alternate reading frame protein isoform X2 [Pongo abelii]